MDKKLAGRLRQIRHRLGLSQRQLAKTAGVANATISQIESGALNPTVGMLKKLLDGIPISLSDFFADEFEFEEKIFFKANELVEITQGNVCYRQVSNNLNNKAIQLLQERYQPGASTGKHTITHKGEECGIILKGHLQVTVNEHTCVLKTGDAYYFNSHQPHHFKNVGRDTCELISACTPPSF